MGRAKAKPIVEQKGRIVTVKAPGYELRAEDVTWATMHRAVIERGEGWVKFTFPNPGAARVAFDEMLEHGAANVDTVADIQFYGEELQALAKKLAGL